MLVYCKKVHSHYRTITSPHLPLSRKDKRQNFTCSSHFTFPHAASHNMPTFPNFKMGFKDKIRKMNNTAFTIRASKTRPDLNKPLPSLPPGAVVAEAVAKAMKDGERPRNKIGPSITAASLKPSGTVHEASQTCQSPRREDQQRPNAPSLFSRPTTTPTTTSICVLIPANLQHLAPTAQLSQPDSLLLPLGLESLPFIDFFGPYKNTTPPNRRRLLLYSGTTTLRQLRLQLLHPLHHAGAVLGLQIAAAAAAASSSREDGVAGDDNSGSGNTHATPRKNRIIRMRLRSDDDDNNDVVGEKRVTQETPGQWHLAKAKAIFLAHVARRMGMWDVGVELVADRLERFVAGNQKDERDGEIEVINWP